MWHNTTGKRLFTTEDGRVVDESDPQAIFLLVGIDGQIAMDIAEKHGLSIPSKPKAAPAPADDSAEKAMPAPANKAKDAPANKGKG